MIKKLGRFLLLIILSVVFIRDSKAMLVVSENIEKCGFDSSSGDIYYFDLPSEKSVDDEGLIIMNSSQVCIVHIDDRVGEKSDYSGSSLSGIKLAGYYTFSDDFSLSNSDVYFNCSYSDKCVISNERICDPTSTFCAKKTNVKYDASGNNPTSFVLTSLKDECPSGYICSDIIKVETDDVTLFERFRLIYGNGILYLYYGDNISYSVAGHVEKEASKITENKPLSYSYSSSGNGNVKVFVSNFNDVFSNNNFNNVNLCYTRCIQDHGSYPDLEFRFDKNNCSNSKVECKDSKDTVDYIGQSKPPNPSDIHNSTVDCKTLLGEVDNPKNVAFYLNVILQVIKYATLGILIVLTVKDYSQAFMKLKDLSAANKNVVYRFILVLLLFVGKAIIDILLKLFGIVGSCDV